jgi:hypothetical protein
VEECIARPSFTSLSQKMSTPKSHSTTLPNIKETTSLRRIIPEARYGKVRKLTEYKDWTVARGLNDFVRAHDVDPDFVNHVCDTGT